MSYEEYRANRVSEGRKAYTALINLYPLAVDDLDGEEWRDIDGYDGKYQVSNFGRVKSFSRSETKILKPQLLNLYLSVELCRKEKKHRRYLIHRLVAETFIPNPDNKPQVNHIDGNKLNDHISNLEWATQSDNIQHSLATGLKKSGEDNPRAVLSNEQVKWIRSVYKPYDKKFGAVPLARKFGVSEQTIRVAVRGKHYKFV